MAAGAAARTLALTALVGDASASVWPAWFAAAPNSRFKAATSLSVRLCWSSASAAPFASAAARRSALRRANDASRSSDLFNSWRRTSTRSLSRARCSATGTTRCVVASAGPAAEAKLVESPTTAARAANAHRHPDVPALTTLDSHRMARNVGQVGPIGQRREMYSLL